MGGLDLWRKLCLITGHDGKPCRNGEEISEGPKEKDLAPIPRNTKREAES